MHAVLWAALLGSLISALRLSEKDADSIMEVVLGYLRIGS
jgi:hypothetical protein